MCQLDVCEAAGNGDFGFDLGALGPARSAHTCDGGVFLPS